MGKPTAYLVAGGKLFSDVAVRTLESAELRRGQRNDDSIIVPLYAIDDETREALDGAIDCMKAVIERKNLAPTPGETSVIKDRIAALERLREQ